MTFKILSVVGARSNFMKIAAICEAIKAFNSRSTVNNVEHVLVHAGRHYDANMSESFFNDLELPKPDISLGVGSASHSVQTAKIMEQFEARPYKRTTGCCTPGGRCQFDRSMCASYDQDLLHVDFQWESFIPKLAHVEAGLRSFDRTMPEEINRIVTDSISDYLFTTEESANKNLVREGVQAE